MPYCPMCREEYQPGIEHCSDDFDEDGRPVRLVPSLAPLPTYDLVEVYTSADALEAEVIRDQVLGANGIEARIHSHVSSAFPAPASQGAHRIAVPAPRSSEALELLRLARAEGVISVQGELLPARG